MRTQGIEGLPVINAKQPITLQITKADITGANTKEPSNCAAARACYRQLHMEARVHLGRVYVKTTKDKWLRFMTPKSLRSEIIAFDRGGDFEPGEYVLAAPQPSRRTGKAQSQSRSKTGKSKRRAARHMVASVRNGPA